MKDQLHHHTFTITTTTGLDLVRNQTKQTAKMRRETKNQYPAPSVEDDDAWMSDAYFTYRPLSNLPTPPPSTRDSSAAQSPKTTLEDGEELQAKFRGMPYTHTHTLLYALPAYVTGKSANRHYQALPSTSST